MGGRVAVPGGYGDLSAAGEVCELWRGVKEWIRSLVWCMSRSLWSNAVGLMSEDRSS